MVIWDVYFFNVVEFHEVWADSFVIDEEGNAKFYDYKHGKEVLVAAIPFGCWYLVNQQAVDEEEEEDKEEEEK